MSIHWKRVQLIFLTLLLTIASTVCTTVGWLLASTGGAKFVLSRIDSLAPVQINYSQLNGNFWDGLYFGHLEIRPSGASTGFTRVSVESLAYQWQPKHLLLRRLILHSLSADRVLIYLPADNDSTEQRANKTAVLPEFSLPFFIEVEQLSVNTLALFRQEKTFFETSQVNARARLENSTLEITELGLHFLDEHYRFYNKTTFAQPLTTELRVDSHGLTGAGACQATPGLECQAEIGFYESSHPIVPGLVIHNGQIELGLQNRIIALSTQLTGSLEQLTANASGRSSIQLDTQEANIDALDIAVSSGGEASFNGALDWSQALTIVGHLQLNKLNLKHWLAKDAVGLPKAELSAAGDIDLDFGEGYPASADIDITHLDIGREPITGKIQAQLLGSQFKLAQLSLKNDTNTLKTSGTYELQSENLAIDMTLDARDLSRLSADLSGSAFLNAQLGGARLSPRVKGSATLSQFGTGELSVSSVAAEVDIDAKEFLEQSISALQINQLSVTAKGFKAGETSAEKVRAELSGSLANNQLTASLMNLTGGISIPELSLVSVLASPPPKSFEALLDSRWQLNLNELLLQDNQQQHWTLKRPASLTLGRQEISLDSLCLAQQPTQICANQLRILGLKQLSAQLTIDGVELNREETLFKKYYAKLPRELDVHGRAQAQLEFDLRLNEHNEPQTLRLRADAHIHQGRIQFTPANKPHLLIPINTFAIKINGDQTQTAILGEALLDGKQQLALNGVLKDLFAQQPGIDLRLQGHMDSLSYLQPFVPQLEDLNGEVAANLRYLESASEPEALLLGTLDIDRLSLLVPSSGARITEMSFHLDAKKSSISLHSQGKVGDGNFTATGRVDATQTGRFPFAASMNIKGSNLTLVDLPDARFNASPNLSISGEDLRWHLHGDLTISDSAYVLRQLPQSASGISEDAVIHGEETVEKKSPVIFTSDLQIIAGEKITFKGFGLDTDVRGRLNYTRNRDGINQVNGALSLPEGEFDTYGQVLNIENGQIRFTGSPTNPALDVRAARTFDTVTAGIWLHGTANYPKTQLYSSPAMGEGDILSYILTGKSLSDSSAGDSSYMQNAALSMGLSKALPMLQQLGGEFGLSDISVETNSATGGGSIAAGKQLNDNLYVKYQYGLMGAVGRFVIEYSLTDNLKVEAGSGETDTVDITYSWDSKPPAPTPEKQKESMD